MSAQPQRPQPHGYPRVMHSSSQEQQQQDPDSEPDSTSEDVFHFLEISEQCNNHPSPSLPYSSTLYTELPSWLDAMTGIDASSNNVQNTEPSSLGQYLGDLNQGYYPAASVAGHSSSAPSNNHGVVQRPKRMLPPHPDDTDDHVPQRRQRGLRSGPRRIVPKGVRAPKDFCVAKPGLMYPTIADAGMIVQGRSALHVTGADDVDTVESQAGLHVRHMLEAFDAEEAMVPPEVEKRTEAEINYFRQWQTESHNAVVGKLQDELPLNSAFAEVRVWAVMCAVVDMHRSGAPKIEEDNTSFKSNLSLKCSERVEQIRSALQQYTIVRLDVLRRARLEQLVADPDAFVRRKLTNVFVNQKKQAKNAAATANEGAKRRRVAD